MGEQDDDFDGDESADESNLVRDLRKQLKAAKKASDDVVDELKLLRKEKSTQTVAELIKAAGASEGYAKFYTGEDTSKEAVAAWIGENKELLGITESEPEPEDAADVRSISQAAANAPQHKIGSIQNAMDLISKAKNPAELQAAYKAAGLQFEQ